MKKLILFICLAAAVCMAACKKEKAEASDTKAADTLEMLSGRVASESYPVTVGTDATVDTVFLSAADSLLTLRATFDDDLIDSAAMASDPAMQKLALELLAANDTIASMIKLASRVPVGLRLEARGREYAPAVSFTITGPTLRSLQLEAPDLRSRDELKVKNRVRYDNASCPFEIEEGVTVVNMSVQDRYVTFHTEIDVEKLDFLVMKQNRDSLNAGVVDFLKAQLADSTQRQSLLDIADARLGYRNRYVASDRRDSFDISFTPADLLQLISVSDSLARVAKK